MPKFPPTPLPRSPVPSPPSHPRPTHTLAETPSRLGVQTVSATGRISDCLSLMVAGGFRHLPVVDKAEVVGVISMRDILHYFLK